MSGLINAKAREWISALRSGKYEQGHGALCIDGKFCCLGVAAEVCGVAHTVESDDGVELRLYGISGSAIRPPEEAIQKLCLTELGAYVLAEKNDKYKKSFNQIADTLERWPEDFFYDPKDKEKENE